MNDDYRNLLIKFGISPTAANVYLALLNIGRGSSDNIAKKASTYKANVYEALHKLIDKGLVSCIIEGKKKVYIPTSPEKLLDVLEENEQKEKQKYEEFKKEMKIIIPKLVVKYNAIKEKDIFEIYRGRNGYKALIRDVLRETPKYWKGFGNLQVQQYFPNNFKFWFKHTKFMLFSTVSEEFSKRLKEARKTTKVEIKQLPEDLYMQIVWTIFGDNLLILIYEPEIIALRIKSEQVCKTFSDQFDYLWKKY